MNAVHAHHRAAFAFRAAIRVLVLALSTAALSSSALAQDIDPSNDSVWTAGGHYTAELNLSGAELKLYPLGGVDQQLSLRNACAPGREVASGVYVLVSGKQGYQLRRTTHGQPQVLGSDEIALTHCEDYNAPRSALRVPVSVLQAFEAAAVGAVYVR